MINKKLDFSTAPEFIQQFENENIENLKQLIFYKWPLWQIIKVPVFYRLLQTNNEGATQSKYKKRTATRIVNASREIASFLKIALSFSRKKSILCVTHYADCLSKKEGKFYNSLFDYIITQKKDNPIYHWEYTSATRNPRYNEPQLKLEAAESFFSKIYKTDVSTQQLETQQFLKNWNEYALKTNTDASAITEGFINEICRTFYQSYLFWKFALKRRTPAKIFSSEKMGTGMLAAANELHIPFYEFQHGNIDKNYPPYVWNKDWNKVGNKIKPDFLIVFGQMAEKTVSECGFFAKDNLVSIGYEKIEDYRAKKIADKEYILFALQPMMHTLNKKIIGCIKTLSKEHKIAIKYHPLQLQSEIDEYELMLNGSYVTLFDKNKNIYDCILESKIVVSHVSTVLEEVLSLGKVSITIATENLPAGIHSMTGNQDLQEAIIPVTIEKIPAFLEKISSNIMLFENMLQTVRKYQFEIYQPNYYDNILRLIENQK